MSDENESKERFLTILVAIGSGETAMQNFIDGLFQFASHDYFRYAKPSLEQRVLALRFVANSLEVEARIGAAQEIAP